MVRKKIFCCFVVVFCGAFLFFAAPVIYKYYRYQRYTGPEYQRELMWLIDDYAQAYCKKHNMELIHIGGFNDKVKTIQFGMWLRSFSENTLEEARVLATSLVVDFLAVLEQDSRAKKCLLELQKSSFFKNYPNVTILDLLGVKIAYWDKEVNRPALPYIADISFYDHIFHYYQAEPRTQKLKLIFEESYKIAVGARGQSHESSQGSGL